MGIIFKPGRSDGEIINGVAYFVRDTKPTVRPFGAALVLGDRWYNTLDGTDWFWRSPYWLSVALYSGGGNISNVAATTNSPITNNNFANVGLGYNIFLENLITHHYCTLANSNNYWDIGVRLRYGTGTGIVSLQDYTIRITSSSPTFIHTTTTTPVNVAFLLSNLVHQMTAIGVKTGTPDNISFVATLSYRLIAP